MKDVSPGPQQWCLRAVGSLWFAAVVLVLILFGMACATVYESMYGAERALFSFYQSRWFTALLCLFSINVLAAVAIKWPYSGRQLGFLLTHVSLVVILIGGLVTRNVGLDGQIALAEGQTVDYFTVPEDTLTLVDLATGDKPDTNLTRYGIGGFDSMDEVHESALKFDDISIDVLQYLPDAQVVQTAVNDASHEHLAVEVSLSSGGSDASAWVFEGRSVDVGLTQVALRKVDDATLAKLIQREASGSSPSVGSIILELGDQQYEFSTDECKDTPQPIGDTGLTLKLLRYLPHATVGADGTLVNSSPRPINPAIEVEIGDGTTVERRIAFAKYPDYQAMHETDVSAGTRVTFRVSESVAPLAPVEVLVNPSGAIHVRLSWSGTSSVIQPVELGKPIDTPWPDRKLVIRQKLDRARNVTQLAATPEVRKDRQPALFVRINTPDRSQEVWLQRSQPRNLSVSNKQYQLMFGNKIVELGFDIKLDTFRVGYYPGGRRPRSFESTVTLNDPAQGGAQARLISMNHPTSFGGFNFYQSSYRMGDGPTVSILSVSRDPGQVIVFVGYFGVMIGMLIVLFNRMKMHTRVSESRGVTTTTNGENGRQPTEISLLNVEARCQSVSGDIIPDRVRARGRSEKVQTHLR